jgi:hypothetical protein
LAVEDRSRRKPEVVAVTPAASADPPAVDGGATEGVAANGVAADGAAAHGVALTPAPAPASTPAPTTTMMPPPPPGATPAVTLTTGAVRAGAAAGLAVDPAATSVTTVEIVAPTSSEPVLT